MIDTLPTSTATSLQKPSSILDDLAPKKAVGDPTSNQLDKDAFLQLLVAQLRYQDPLNPSDPADFMATTAQFTTIEKLDELTQQGANNAIVTGLSMASSLVGRSVDYMGANDSINSSVVTSAQVVGGQVRLMTEDGPVDLASVVGIGVANPKAATPSTATPSTATPSTATPSTGTDVPAENTTATEPTAGNPATVQQPAEETTP